METGLRKMKCGCCGKDDFKVYLTQEDTLIIECNHCKSTTNVKPEPSKIELSFGEKSQGILYVSPNGGL